MSHPIENKNITNRINKNERNVKKINVYMR